MNTPTRRRAGTGARLAATLVAGAVLAGCSGTDEPDEPRPTGSSSAPSTGGSAPVSSTLVDRQVALRHLTITACPSGEGRLEATGSVRNRGDDTADYVVTVTWLDEDGATLASVETTVEDVAPATNEEWTASADLDEAAGSCTTAAARGSLPDRPDDT